MGEVLEDDEEEDIEEWTEAGEEELGDYKHHRLYLSVLAHNIRIGRILHFLVTAGIIHNFTEAQVIYGTTEIIHKDTEAQLC